MEDSFDGVDAMYGGSFFLPSEEYPHGTFEVTSIYAWMDSYDEELFEEVYEWMDDRLMGVDNEKETPDEFSKVTAEDENNNRDVSYVRAWWD